MRSKLKMTQVLSQIDRFVVIFDMDGVIVDNMVYHRKAWEIFIQKHGLDVDLEDFSTHFGMINRELLNILFPKKLSDEEAVRLAEEKEALYREICAEEMVPIPGLVDFLKELKRNEVKTVIATSAPQANVDFVLDRTKTRDFFDVIIGPSEVKRGKPDPEIYLLAAQKVQFPPPRCLVFEDSLAGIQAAKRAGMKVIGVATSFPMEKLIGTARIIRDFREMTFAMAEELMKNME